jgi:hypothetical protein
LARVAPSINFTNFAIKMIQPTLTLTIQPTARASASMRAARWAPLLASLVLVACAAVPQGTPEEQVRQRASERWQALVAGDFAKAYTYSTPGFKAVVAADAYKDRFRASWHGADVVQVSCAEPAKCTAKVRIDMKYMVKSTHTDSRITTHADESWLLEDGQWSIFQAL